MCKRRLHWYLWRQPLQQCFWSRISWWLCPLARIGRSWCTSRPWRGPGRAWRVLHCGVCESENKNPLLKPHAPYWTRWRVHLWKPTSARIITICHFPTQFLPTLGLYFGRSHCYLVFISQKTLRTMFLTSESVNEERRKRIFNHRQLTFWWHWPISVTQMCCHI